MQYDYVAFVRSMLQHQTFGQLEKKERNLIGLWNIAKLMLLCSLSRGKYE
jgi:hypothetical protein